MDGPIYWMQMRKQYTPRPSTNTVCRELNKYGQNLTNRTLYEQEAHGPPFAHLSDIATVDMQMLCNIFPILSSQLMKESSFERFWRRMCFLSLLVLPYMGITDNGTFEQTLNPASTVGSTWNLVKIGQVVSEDELFDSIMILYMYIERELGSNPHRLKF